MDILDPRHEALVAHLFDRTCCVLGMQGFEMKPLRRRLRGQGKFRSFAYGYTRLSERSITIDLYTPRTMKPRKLDAILRVICHELAHHQSPPRVMLIRWKRVVVAHHPHFWRQVKKNVSTISKDELLRVYFE
ncbi:MAG: hypothetical protein WC477_05660 [Patescibacteria group bacterium]